MGSIGSTLNSINSSLLSEIQQLSGTAAASSSATQTDSTGDVVDFSQVSTLFNDLQQLQTSNPTEFKQVLTDGATKLAAAAQQQTDPNAAAFLNNLASRFQTAADSGNLSALSPQQTPDAAAAVQGGGGHHHHHHGGGVAASSADSDGDSTDTAQTSSDSSSSTSSSSISTPNSTAQTTTPNLFSFLNALDAQSPQTLFGSLAPNQSGQNGTDAQNALAAILSSGPNSASGQQIQNVLANYISSSAV